MATKEEHISLYLGRKALIAKGVSRHISEFDVVSDQTGDDGTRTIVIKPADKTEHLKRCKELAGKMVERLGEGENKLLRAMLYDTLRDYKDSDVEDMYKKVVLGEAPVKHREGCFKIIIGDGRRRGHHEIQLID